MYLTHLSLTNFRNFARLDVDLPQGAILLLGANGQGKTSLLEAIYYLAALTSFHAIHDRELINFIAARDQLAVGRIVARFTRAAAGPDAERSHKLEVRLIRESDGSNGNARLRKEVLLDGAKLKVGHAMGKLTAVLFLPQMVQVIEGAPEDRRRFLNLAMSQAIPGFSQTLADYAQALSQRNSLLKQLQEFGGDPSQLDYWDELLAVKGSAIILARIQVIQELERLAAREHFELTHSQAVLRCSYQPAFDPLPQPNGQIALRLVAPVDRSRITLDQARQGLVDGLRVERKAEIARGVTSLGPHRDELRFLENGIDLGTYGSRGQVRTALLSLKIAEVAWMHARTGQAPVLLLDEALAELDPNRRADLLARLVGDQQTLLTTTDLALFSPEFVHRATLWHIAAGRLEKQPNASA
jgi:DNA replication and repair protein RecF